ncbi:Mobile element protein [Candidatus Enterovibrio escicola]|uniref:Mobile element protein n=1 Tax=Candidatus Enterovibrio escicola TaxID=1927127 RepID=A0A2A5T4Z0_9GAMM|nr:Mobile element protein [Candidatus Enterovibrio escacola]
MIRPSYRLVTTYAFSDIRCLKVPRSEEKERWGGSYGYKLDLIINDQGSIISVKVTTANVDDRKPIS